MQRYGGNPQPQRQNNRRGFGPSRFGNGSPAPPNRGGPPQQQMNSGIKPLMKNAPQSGPTPQTQPQNQKPPQQQNQNQKPPQQQNVQTPSKPPAQQQNVQKPQQQATPKPQPTQQPNANMKTEPVTPNKPEQTNTTPNNQASGALNNSTPNSSQGASKFQGNQRPNQQGAGNFQGNKGPNQQGANFQGNKGPNQQQGGGTFPGKQENQEKPGGPNFQGNKGPNQPQQGGGNFQANKGPNQPQQGGGNFQANKGPNQPQQGGGNFQGNKGPNQQGPGNFQGNKGPNQNQGGANMQGNQFSNQQNQGGGNFARRQNDFGGPRNQQRGPGGPRQGGDGQNGPREQFYIGAKLKEMAGPLIDLPPLEQPEEKFNGRSRLYVGNLPPDMTEEALTEMFSAYGETAELFHNKEKGFAFVKIDYRSNAEKAKRELDGTVKHGRPVKIRFAAHNATLRIQNLSPFVSNELLYKAFEIFGKIERAFVKVDERGKSLCEGIVEYARKPSAMAAVRHCSEKCFFLTSSLKPVIVELFEEPDETDGYQEKNLPRRHPDYHQAREMGPRFSEPGSFEHEYGTRWKQLHELFRQKEDALKKEKQAEEDKLEAQMEFAKYEHETELLRQQLRQREEDRERQKRSWEMVARSADDRKEQDMQSMMKTELDMTDRMRRQDDELRRRQQENTLFVQAQQLSSLLDRQEQSFDGSPMSGGRGGPGGFAKGGNFQAPGGNFQNQGPWNDMGGGRGFEDNVGGGMGGMGSMGAGNGRWEKRPMQDDFPNKRRRF